MYRSSTSQSHRKTIKTPTPIEQIQNRKKSLLSRNNSRTGHQSQLNHKQISTPFRQTGITYNRPHNMGDRIKSSSQIVGSKKINGFLSQNFNFGGNANRKVQEQALSRNSVPLRLLRATRLTSQEQQAPIFTQRFASHRHRPQFLRKGASINRAIMFNVLKSKCSKTITDSANSYVNYPGNAPLANAIYDQVPKGLRDIVGAEQMLRMSNIFTGGTISSINLHRKVNEVINKYHQSRPVPIEDDEGMTLKSIKRW